MHTPEAAALPFLGAGARLPWVLAKSLPPPPMDLGDSKKFLERIRILDLFYTELPPPFIPRSHFSAACSCVGPLSSLGHLWPSQDEGLVFCFCFCFLNSGLVIFNIDFP